MLAAPMPVGTVIRFYEEPERYTVQASCCRYSVLTRPLTSEESKQYGDSDSVV
jgi:hypothetical protein